MEKSNSLVKIAIVGAESTGKTGLCEGLASFFNTTWVPEFAREYFNDSNIYNYSLNDLEIIAKKQLAMEQEAILKAKRFLFCDTSLITLKIWAELEFKTVPQSIQDLMKQSHYDYYLITNNQVPWEKDELRQNKFSRELIFKMNLNEVEDSGTAYSIVSGLDKDRLDKAISLVNYRFR
jgi:NadR type nicotinamide-nucleotide adenylyltransferase